MPDVLLEVRVTAGLSLGGAMTALAVGRRRQLTAAVQPEAPAVTLDSYVLLENQGIGTC